LAGAACRRADGPARLFAPETAVQGKRGGHSFWIGAISRLNGVKQPKYKMKTTTSKAQHRGKHE
jgi:hypothetical protein